MEDLKGPSYSMQFSVDTTVGNSKQFCLLRTQDQKILLLFFTMYIFLFPIPFNESTAIHPLPYCCTVKNSCLKQIGCHRYIKNSNVCLCVYEKTIFKILLLQPILMPVFIVRCCERTSLWLGHIGDLEHSVSCFILRELLRDRLRWQS